VRIRTFWVLGVVLVAALAYGSYRLVAWPGFRLERLDVRGERVTPRDEIVRRAGIDPRANVWLVDFRAVSERIEALPYVRTARLRHVPRAAIAIDIVEREPDGCLEGAGGKRVLIDADRRVLAENCDARPFPAFRVTSVVPPAVAAFVHAEELARLQTDAHALQAAGVSYQTLRHDRYGELDAMLSNGVTVRFGDETTLDVKARLVGPVLRSVAGQQRRVASLDLRAPAAPVVRFREANADGQKR
jgi:cell division septal protein FtsQ